MTIDDDLQHDPGDIPKLVATPESGFDLVYGRPWQPEHSGWRRLNSWLLRRMHKLLLGNPLALYSSSLRVFRTCLREAFLNLNGQHVNFDASLSWATSNVGVLPVFHRERPGGKGSYSFRRLVSIAKNSITTFSTRPLRLIIVLGLSVGLLGIVLFIWAFYLGIKQQNGIPGFPFLASAVSLFAGVQLVCLGVIGEYVGQVDIRSMNVPTFIVMGTALVRRKTS